MRLLLHTMPFFPRIGGIETVSEMLASEISRQGHDVTLVTQTPPAEQHDDERFPFRVIRQPGFLAWRRAIKSAEVYLQFNVSLKGLVPWLGTHRPLVISHHGWYGPASIASKSFGRETAGSRFKKWIARRFATNLACSKAVARQIGPECEVVPNPYRDDLFFERHDVPRDRDLVFLGRLVSDKGCDLALDALSLLARDGLRPSLDFVGSGPELPRLQERAAQLGLAGQVRFAGPLQGEQLARELNRYRIMVIPSRVLEGFGVVALEGIASGCVVVGADAGGLPEAIGPAGRVFPIGDAGALASDIRILLSDPASVERHRLAARDHLARHNLGKTASAYAAICHRARQGADGRSNH